jgi:hypothetical protein
VSGKQSRETLAFRPRVWLKGYAVIVRWSDTRIQRHSIFNLTMGQAASADDTNCSCYIMPFVMHFALYEPQTFAISRLKHMQLPKRREHKGRDVT